jgi:hypothetical protein
MKKIVEKIIQIPFLYARLLNTLSLLEYIGGRKIIKSQQQETINYNILAHAAEELRHAQVLKKAALKLEPDLCKTYAAHSLLCGAEACDYFQKIDHAAIIETQETDAWKSYLYTSYLIETRAIKFYKLFEEVLAEHHQMSVFRGILIEENRHLDEIEMLLKQVITNNFKLKILQDFEEQTFNQLIEVINNYVLKS